MGTLENFKTKNTMDATENFRRGAVGIINSGIESNDEKTERARLEKEYGADNVFDTKQLGQAFEVIGFMAPFCIVRHKETGKKGSIMFQHSPRLYFGFQPS